MTRVVVAVLYYLSGPTSHTVTSNSQHCACQLLKSAWPESAAASTSDAANPPGTLMGRLRAGASAIICGGLAGTIMWATVLPLDVAKTRIQVAMPGSKRDLGLLATLAKLRREGKLYSGLAPTLVRAFPANAAQWLAWEVAADLLQGW